jgi:hypothetical protein
LGDEKMSVASNRDEFIQRIATALEEEVGNSPTQDQVRRYFRTLRGSSQSAIEAYEGYATHFFVHVDNSRNPGSNVIYPGGAGGRNTCDNLTEVLARRSEGGRHVIDCRGFSVMGIELLQEAGFTSPLYMIAIPPSATGDSWLGHVFVRIASPDGSRLYIGNNHIYTSPSGAVERLAGWSPQDSLNVRYAYGDTYQEALEEAVDIVETRDDYPMSDSSRVAPLSPRRSGVPSLRME